MEHEYQENKTIIMLTKETLENYTIKELENIFSATVNLCTIEDVETRYIKSHMYDRLTTHFPTIEFTHDSYLYTSFTIKFKYYIMVFNLSVKSTGKTKQITRLRAKDIKKPNGVKLKTMYYSGKSTINNIILDTTITNDYILKKDEKWITTIDNNMRHEVKNKNLKLAYIASDAYFKENIDANESQKEKIKKQLLIFGAQSIFFNQDKYKPLLKKYGYPFDDEHILLFVYDRNKQFIDNCINELITH